MAGTPDDPRRAQVEEAFNAVDIFKAMEGVHPVDFDEPEEDFPIFKMSFKSWTFAAQFHVPDYARWLAGSGSGDAYGYHRRMVQHFTWQRRQATPGQEGQWLFKMPFHLKELETLLETYPDALFIQTRRAPCRGLGILEQPGGKGALGRRGAAPARRDRRRAACVHERHAERGPRGSDRPAPNSSIAGSTWPIPI